MKLVRFPRIARVWYRHFEILSVLFVATFLLSSGYSAYAVYNLAAYGSCDPHSTECIFNPGEISCESVMCGERGCFCETLGCEEPEYLACKGDCSCIKDVCG